MFQRFEFASQDRSSSYPTTRRIMRWTLASFYAAAGVAHLLVPRLLLTITPSWVPFAPKAILITGVLEILGSIALVTGQLRKSAGILMAIYAYVSGQPISSMRSMALAFLTYPRVGGTTHLGLRFSLSLFGGRFSVQALSTGPRAADEAASNEASSGLQTSDTESLT